MIVGASDAASRRASAERFEDAAAAEDLIAERQHHALPRRHRALRAAELHADPLTVERLDHGRHVVAAIADADGRLERPVVRGVAGTHETRSATSPRRDSSSCGPTITRFAAASTSTT